MKEAAPVVALRPSCSGVDEAVRAASFAAKALSSLFPHSTRYSPAMMNTAPMILHPMEKREKRVRHEKTKKVRLSYYDIRCFSVPAEVELLSQGDGGHDGDD